MQPILERWFHLEKHQTNCKKEIAAGLTTFATLAYAILLIPSILSETGMPFGAVMSATLLASAYASIMMGFLANYPFALAPGIVLAVYFSHAVVQSGGHTWQEALGVVFLCGVTFIALNLLRIRQLIIEAIPQALRIGTTAGLGVLLALVALKHAGVVVEGGFGSVTDPSVYMTGLGVLLIAVLMVFRVKGALFLGILINWAVCLLLGFTKWQGVISWPESLASTWFALDVKSVFSIRLLSAYLSFLFVGLFDTAGTLVALAEMGQFLKPCPNKTTKCHFPNLGRALIPDATGSVVAGVLGTSTLSIYLESAAGIEMGGRTGLSNVVLGICLLLTLFFAPFAQSIPAMATAAALIIVGFLLLKQVRLLKWDDPTEWIAGCVTLVLIPLTFNIATGIGVGMILFPLIKLVTGRAKQVHWMVWILAAVFVAKLIFLPTP